MSRNLRDRKVFLSSGEASRLEDLDWMEAANIDAKPGIAGSLSVSLVNSRDVNSSTRSHHSVKIFMGSSTKASKSRRGTNGSLAVMR